MRYRINTHAVGGSSGFACVEVKFEKCRGVAFLNAMMAAESIVLRNIEYRISNRRQYFEIHRSPFDILQFN